MKVLTSLAAAALLAAAAAAQGPAQSADPADQADDEPKPGSSRPMRGPQTRLDLVSEALDSRLTTQTDYWFEDGDFPRVISVLRMQCDLDTDNYELWTNLIWMYGNIRESTKELATAIEFRELNKNWGEAWYPEAELYFRRGMRAKAIPLLEQSIALGPVHPNNYRLLANAWRSMGFPAQSVRVWELLLKYHPNDARAKAQLDRVRKEAAQNPK